MFHLGGSSFPQNKAELIAAVTEGLARVLTLPAGRTVLTIDGGDFPPYTRISLDLTGARVNTDHIPPEPRGTGKNQPGAFATRLQVLANPLYVYQAGVNLNLSAADARFDYDRDKDGRPVLLLVEARDGQVTLEVGKQELEALVLAAAREGAGKQGVQIQETHLTLTQIDSRSVGVEVRVKAKKMFLSAAVNLRGKLSVDESLNAAVNDLTISGEGMLGDMASAALRPKLQEISGKNFPLTALSLGQVRLRDLRVQVGNSLKITAAFGS